MHELEILRKRLAELREELEESRYDETASNEYWYGLSMHIRQIETEISICEAERNERS